MSTLPDPELYIIVDGRPTKDKIVWQSIVDVDNVRHAVEKLRETSWLYRTVNEDSVDEATKKTIEVVSLASNPILERASADDINGLQAHTIRKMDQYMPTGRDTTNYLVFMNSLWTIVKNTLTCCVPQHCSLLGGMGSFILVQ